MINLFQIAPHDASITYLGQIFGSMNGVIPQISNAPDTGTISLLGTMFKTFNSVILALGALIVVYTTVVGVIMTAHEGEFMGKKWNNIWIPIRTVLGIAALVPTGSGFSAIQIVIMWIIIQGIGAADTLWNTALGYVSIVGSPYAQVSLPGVAINASMEALFQGLVCDATARMPNEDPGKIIGGNYYCNTHAGEGFCNDRNAPALKSNQYSYQMGPSGSCATLSYCNQAQACSTSNSLACLACKSQITALQAIIPTLAGVARQFVNIDYNYRDFYYKSHLGKQNGDWQFIYNYCSAQTPSISQDKCCVPSHSADNQCNVKKKDSGAFKQPNQGQIPQNPSNEAVTDIYWPYGLKPSIGNVDFINTATTYYSNQLNNTVTSYIQSQGQDPSNLNSDLKTAAKDGWIFAGGYYYVISKTNNKMQENSFPAFSVAAQSLTTGNPMAGFRNNYDAASTLITAAGNSAAQAPSGGGNGTNNCNPKSGSTPSSGIWSKMTKPVSDTVGETSCLFQASISQTNANPLARVQAAGESMLGFVGYLFDILLGVAVGLGIAGNLSDIFAMGFGDINPIGPATLLVFFVLIPALMALLGLMITLGALLGVYTPLIPYIVFTFGAIGWLTSTIEAMVAAPLVALGILSPSGQHEILGKAEPALMLLFNIFLRPSLMIFGLIAAMLLASVVVTMINTMFSYVMFQISKDITGPLGIIEYLIFLGAYVYLIVSALGKCFSAIHIIPEKVMRWISGQPGESYGEEQALGEAKQGATGVASGAAGVAAAGGGVGQRAAETGKKFADQRKAEGGVSGKGSSGGGSESGGEENK